MAAQATSVSFRMFIRPDSPAKLNIAQY